jgi:uncharacterized protein YqhQ
MNAPAKTKRRPTENEKGVKEPVVMTGRGVKVTAWRNLDGQSDEPAYDVVIRVGRSQRGEHDFFALPVDQIKAIGEHMLKVHARLTSAMKA